MIAGELVDYIVEMTGVSKAAAGVALRTLLATFKAGSSVNFGRLGAVSVPARAKHKRPFADAARGAHKRALSSARTSYSSNQRLFERERRARKIGENVVGRIHGKILPGKGFKAISPKGLKVQFSGSSTNVSRLELLDQVMKSANLSKVEALRALDGAFVTTKSALQNTGEVSLQGNRIKE